MASVRDVYEAVLVEMNKENAPNILLEDFNLFLNKAINQFVNKRYNIYEVNQQVTDDLSVLKGTAIFVDKDSGVSESTLDNKPQVGYFKEPNSYLNSKVHTGTYQFTLPKDYFHILNCTCTFEVVQNYRCYDAGDVFEIGATKLQADAWNSIVNNFWNKPTYRRPYFYIHYGAQVLDSNRRNSIREANERDGHPQNILCELRVGTDKSSVFKLTQVTIDYLKVPKFYRLTQSQLDLVEDKSDILEFPDYVCWEIVNELVHIIMENISDQRLQTHPVVSQSIANPTQAQAPDTTGKNA